MHRAKVFNKVTKKGTVLKIVKEHYLRDDVVCGSKVLRRPPVGPAHPPSLPARRPCPPAVPTRPPHGSCSWRGGCAPTGMHGVPNDGDGRGPGRVAGRLDRAADQAALPRPGHQRLHQPGPSGRPGSGPARV